MEVTDAGVDKFRQRAGLFMRGKFHVTERLFLVMVLLTSYGQSHSILVIKSGDLVTKHSGLFNRPPVALMK